ncbi:MAG: bifunctional UDP-3-O-[3-hydroxymyristoyl] N-acetylglucosamine deacetylase/3-hydroxyacyl-ACP dehydratase [Candidatus Eiseniibacteriota bacterium]|jgi:UDP-3-O-[3-hydroxymyristoyl] N-acetylglucosamine deacetylase/3-hydroxyacyl-[acyl-carrier-protein] dehydratase
MAKQRTIERAVSYEGVGIHTGKTARVRLCPGAVNSGIVFVRVDLDGRPCIPVTANAAHYDPQRGRRTILRNGNAEVHTVEHLLAAIHGLSIDNLTIELDDEEPGEPRDGSALPIVALLRSAGLVDQPAPRRYFNLAHAVSLDDEGGIQLLAVPDDHLRITFTIEYPDTLVGTQSITLDIDEETFEREIAPARTFVLERDVAGLRQAGMIKGGSLDNAVVVGEDRVLNDEPLRFPDEFVRHKVLDLLGDLYLLGAPVRAHILAFKSGHRSHVRFVKKLVEAASNTAAVARPTSGENGEQIWDIQAIERIMPHRYPMLLVDRILELTDERVVAIKNVTVNEPYFVGHFPGHPIMPAVLTIEAMAQAGGFLLLNRVEEPDNKLVYFMGINNAKFRRPVLPGDQLRFELSLVKLKGGICKMRGMGYVDGKLVAEADLLASVVER